MITLSVYYCGLISSFICEPSVDGNIWPAAAKYLQAKLLEHAEAEAVSHFPTAISVNGLDLTKEISF